MKTQSPSNRWLTVGTVRRSPVYQPLAVLLILLLLPWASGILPAGHAPSPFAAHAQINLGCFSNNNSIIQNYCGDDSDPDRGTYSNDLRQLESDAVNAYLATHGMNGVNNSNGGFVNTTGNPICVSGPVNPGAACPAADSDAQIIYDYGRSDLRSAVRGTIVTILKGIIVKPAAQRTAHERALYNWLFGLVKANEIRTYQNAVDHVNSFFNNPCQFTVDPDIAAVNNVAYNGIPFCYGLSSIFAPQTPNRNYFLSYGLKQGYAASAATDPQFPRLVAQATLSHGAIIGIGAASASVVAATVSAAMLPNFTLALTIFLAEGAKFAVATQASGLILSGAAVDTVGLAGSVIGPAAIAFVAVLVGVIAGLEVFENEKVIQHVNTLRADLTRVQSTPPDLLAMVQDTTGLGTYKIVATITARSSPDKPSTRALPLNRPGIDAGIGTNSGVANATTYLGSDMNLYTVSTWGRWFVQTCANGKGHKFTYPLPFPGGGVCGQTDSIIADLNFIRPNFYNPAGVFINYPTWEPMVASRIGETTFNISKSRPRKNDFPCPPDPYQGVTLSSPLMDTGRCSAWTARNFIFLDDLGFRVETGLYAQSPAAFLPLTAPLSFSLGVPSTRTISAGGNPTPTITNVSIQSFPQGFSGLAPFTFPTSTGNDWNLTFNGTTDPTKAGTYVFKMTTSNQWGSETKTFSVTVANTLAIVSPNTITGVAGIPLTFKVVATGSPRPQLTAQNLGQAGSFTFTDNLDGTGTISGTYTSFSLDLLCFVGSNCPSITATNSQGTIKQNLNFTFSLPPAPKMYPQSAVFIAGINNQVKIATAGAITPVNITYSPDPNAPWLSFVNLGDGTATLTGTPPLAAGTFTPFIGASTAGALNLGVAFPITVRNAPIFTSLNTTTLKAGSPASFDITTNTGTISLLDTLPAGLTLDTTTPAIARLRGTPTAGTGGSYKLTFSAVSGPDSAQQTFFLNINEGAKFISPATATAVVGVPAAIQINVSGFPSRSADQVPGTEVPTDPADGLGMYMRAGNLPPFLSASNLSPQGFATGTMVLTGTPALADLGTYSILIAATNGVGFITSQTLSLTVLKSSGNAQTISFSLPSATHTFGDNPFSISATASSGLPVTFKSNTTPVCTVSASTVTLAGGGTCTLQADQPGDGVYSAAPPVTQSFFVGPATTVLTWTNPANIQYGTPLSATQLNAGSSGPGTLNYSPGTGAVLSAGQGQTLSVSFTPTDPGKYTPATKSVTINVDPTPNPITFSQPPNKALGTGSVALSATAASGGAVGFATNTPAICTVSGATATLLAVGTCSITATAPASGNYLAATPVGRTFTVLQPPPSITSLKVLWGTRSYEVIGSSRNRLPWQITGVQATFSSPVTAATAGSLGGGLVSTGLTGLGTSTLTWTINPVSVGQFNAAFSGAGDSAIRNADGTALGNGAGATQLLRVLYADYNDDGVVNASDLVFIANLMRSATYNLLGDLNGDGVVDNSDLLLARGQIGKTLP